MEWCTKLTPNKFLFWRKMMAFSAKKQRGLTFISLVLVLALIAFFVLLTLKIAPIYMNHSKVVNALNAVENMPDINKLRKPQIITSFAKRFNINYVDKVDISDIVITKGGGITKVVIEYERVEKIVGNLSVLVEFHESFEVGGD